MTSGDNQSSTRSAGKKDPSVVIEHGFSEDPKILALLEQSAAFSKSLYPAESNHTLDVTSYHESNVNFISARDQITRDIVGCGAVVILNEEQAELKSMFVAETSRGRGIAKRIVSELEHIAESNGAKKLVLETGVKQQEAIALYKRCGYSLRGAFSDYKEDPLSVFMEKSI